MLMGFSHIRGKPVGSTTHDNDLTWYPCVGLANVDIWGQDAPAWFAGGFAARHPMARFSWVKKMQEFLAERDRLMRCVS